MSSSRPGPPDGKRATNRREKTARIARAFLARALEEGVVGVTVDAVCADAGIAKGSFYRYFESKEAVVAHLMRPLEQAFGAAATQVEASLETSDASSAALAYAPLVATLLPLLEEHRDALRLYLQEVRSPAHGARAPIGALGRSIEEGARRLSESARRAGWLRDVDLEVSRLAVLGAVERLLLQALREPPGRAKAGRALSLVDLLLHGMLRGEGG